MTTAWRLAALALIPPLLVALLAAGRGPIGARLVGVQLSGSLGCLILLALSFAFDQSSSIDLALTLAALSLPGTLLLALFFERWL